MSSKYRVIAARKVTNAKGHFPSDEAAMKLLYLALRNAEKKWTMVARFWNSALDQLVIYFPGRLPHADPLHGISDTSHTHDYKRHGVLDLYAALNVATGEVAHACNRATAATPQLISWAS